MSSHPYQSIPSMAHWRHAVAKLSPDQIDPAIGFKFKLSKTDKVATGGSCFAQHIARYLRQSGFHYYVVEKGHPISLSDINDAFNYGVFSARYGNIYTSRQLVQLFDRAFAYFEPDETHWRNAQGNFLDPFRPTIEPQGFASEEELLADRILHLQRVKQMFINLDYFVFTLGLTECWLSRTDGAVFPICPGVAGGVFDENSYHFKNLSVAEVIADLRLFREKLLVVNPRAKIILTVSPVPLMATMENRHVLLSNSASKSILRVAADDLANNFDNVAYFPSYEIITSPFSGAHYFGPDLRSVTEAGVAHVMHLFSQHCTSTLKTDEVILRNYSDDSAITEFTEDAKKIVEVICDENLL